MGCAAARLQLFQASWARTGIRDDGTSREIGTLIGILYRRLLHKANGLGEVRLAVRKSHTACPWVVT